MELNLKERRERLGLSQRALAAASHVSIATINNAEHGKHRPFPATVKALDAALRKFERRAKRAN